MRMFRVESPEVLIANAKKGRLFEEGDIVPLEGFTAASATKNAVEAVRRQFGNEGYNMNVEIELFVPKGAKAIPLSKASRLDRKMGTPKYEFQQEWLFQKDTEALVLEKRQRNGKVFLKLLILNHERKCHG